jgi:hypothetical protein
VLESNEGYSHPRVFNSRRLGVSTYGNTSPVAPEYSRREVQWIYGQSAPGVIGGDFYYYLLDHDLTSSQARNIDTSRVAVHLLSGQYGASSGPTGTAALAAQITGATHAVISGANYLPMTDDYPRLRQSLLPVLKGILEKSDANGRRENGV